MQRTKKGGVLGPVHPYPEIFVSANFFYADTPSVNTCPPSTLGVS